MNTPIRAITSPGTEVLMTGDATAKLAEAVRILGGDEQLRNNIVALCRAVERKLGLGHGDVRETITGPIVDALHAPGMLLRKELANGLVFEFAYRSKIAREFVLAPDVKPDHVWEPQTTRLLLHFSSRAQNVLIGGGYIGDHAILIAHAMKRNSGVCHVFELNPEAISLMRTNAQRNGIENLVLQQLGLWNVTGSCLSLVGNDSHAHPVLADDSALRETFRTMTIDDYAENEKIDRLDLIMLDIEGGEEAALQGASRFLHQPSGKAPVVIFEVHRSYVDWSNGLRNTSLVRLMLEAGYHVFAIRDFQSNIPMGNSFIELLPLDAVYLEGPPHGFNMLAVKDKELLDLSVFRFCENKSPKLLLYKSPELHYPTEWLTCLPAWAGSENGLL